MAAARRLLGRLGRRRCAGLFRRQLGKKRRAVYLDGRSILRAFLAADVPQRTVIFVAALPPGSAFHTCPALALPGLALAAAVPTAWAAWALLAEPPDGLPPEQLLEQAPGFDFATLCDFERPAAVP